MSFRSRYLLATGGWFLLVEAAIVGLSLSFRDRLPDPLATHWGVSGAPDDAMSFAAFLAVQSGLWLLLAALVIVPFLRGGPLRKKNIGKWIAAYLGAAGVFTLLISLSTCVANLDREHWRQAGSVSWHVVVVLGVSAGAGVIGWLLARSEPEESGRSEEPAITTRLKADERVAWISVVSSSAMRVLMIAVATAILGWGLLSEWNPGWTFAVGFGVPGVLAVGFSSLRVKADEREVRIAFGPQRWPTRRIPLERIAGARVEDRRPVEVGGWGYRGLPGRATIMIRGGECLILEYVSGGELGISIDDAERGAALINGLVTERSVLAEGE